MRIMAIAMLGSLFLLPAALPANSAVTTVSQQATTSDLSAATEKKTKAAKKTKKMKKEKVEYMRSAAPPEPKK
jgi:hypothetical protein